MTNSIYITHPYQVLKFTGKNYQNVGNFKTEGEARTKAQAATKAEQKVHLVIHTIAEFRHEVGVQVYEYDSQNKKIELPSYQDTL